MGEDRAAYLAGEDIGLAGIPAPLAVGVSGFLLIATGRARSEQVVPRGIYRDHPRQPGIVDLVHIVLALR